MNLPLFIAKRINGSSSDEKRVSKPAITIATAGVAIGLAVMIVSVCVVLGFKHTIRDKVTGFGGHIQISNFLSSQGSDSYPICIEDSTIKKITGISGVRHVERFTITQGILKTDSDFLGVVFKGVGEDYDMSFIKSNIKEGEVPAFRSDSSTYKLLISKTIADKLGIKVGDRIFSYFIGNEDVRARRFTIAGIYETNMSQFDGTICFTDIRTATKLNGWKEDQCSGAEVILNDIGNLDDVEQVVVKNVNRTKDKYHETFTSQTILDLYPNVFSWLELLDMNIWIILILMVCVAGFTMISGLLIIILERTQMIGLLKALGARNGLIRRTFLWFATFIIGRGMIIGNILGIGLCLLQKATGLVKLDASTYYVSTVPVEINIPILLLLNVATLAVSVFVLIAPSYLISRIHPARSMHYE